MQELNHILFPVDLSEACRRFAPVVRMVACRAGARVTMLNALELPTGYYSNPHDMVDLMRSQRVRFRQFLKAEMASLPSLSRISRHGEPGKAIVDYARNRHAGVIMMPTHGIGPFRRLLLGSVTAKVLHDAACPVWTSAHSSETPQPERLRKVLCAVDLSEPSVAVMQYALSLSRLFGTELRFLNVVPIGESWTVRHFETEFAARMEELARERMTLWQQRAGAPGEATVRSGDVAHCVRREAIDWEADVIVIGRGVIAQPLGHLRSAAYAIIRESPCPVLSI